MTIKILVLLAITLGIGLSIGCKKSETLEADSATETAQNIGDVMASVDESGGDSNGAIAAERQAAERVFARYAPDETNLSVSKYLLPNAVAATCDGSGFSSCTGASITRTFNGCTIGVAQFDGTVNLTWTDNNGAALGACTLGQLNDRITRVPNFTVTGRRGAVLAVTRTGSIGQRITRGGSAGVYTFTNDGINRKFTTAAGAVLFDQTTSTNSAINVSSATRAGRVMNGGSLRVTNNLSSVTCNYVPTSVTWSAGCNCPTSGSWSGTCSNGNSTTFTITGCGVGDFTDGTFSSRVTLDRCGT
jgi:hypothetical protein